MEIIIEIGDENQKKKIKSELEYLFKNILEKTVISTPIEIYKIIVPLDFNKTVNTLQGTSNFNSVRGKENASVEVLAKTIYCSNEISIIISPIIYFSAFDTMVRCFVLSHEICHLINKNSFPKVLSTSFSEKSYLGSLYSLFDEYVADRFAFAMTQKLYIPSESWNRFNLNSVQEYLKPVTDPRYYDFIQKEISSFRIHGDVNYFWNAIIETVNLLTMSTTHGFARYHEFPIEFEKTIFPESKFLNERTFVLMDYFKSKYDQIDNNLMNGIPYISNYLKNFGMQFEEIPEGGYFRVIDI